jgi:hypothetical protein
MLACNFMYEAAASLQDPRMPDRHACTTYQELVNLVNSLYQIKLSSRYYTGTSTGMLI